MIPSLHLPSPASSPSIYTSDRGSCFHTLPTKRHCCPPWKFGPYFSSTV